MAENDDVGDVGERHKKARDNSARVFGNAAAPSLPGLPKRVLPKRSALPKKSLRPSNLLAEFEVPVFTAGGYP